MRAGPVLLQEDWAGIEHPVCYFSKKFSKSQQNYSTTEKEALALAMALRHFEVYVGGNCAPLVTLIITPLSSCLACSIGTMRWSLYLQEYKLGIQHQKGSENVVADALSVMGTKVYLLRILPDDHFTVFTSSKHNIRITALLYSYLRFGDPLCERNN